MKISNSKKFTFSVIISAIALFIIMQAPEQIDAMEIKEFNHDQKNYNAKLQIFDSNKEIAQFNVAIADSDAKKMYGLMNLSQMPQDNGMLFIFPKKKVVSMWMKNTRISLDMIFIDESDNIVNIKENATPYSLDLINSEYLVTKVLEINGGLARKYKILSGQKIKLTKRDVGFFK